MLLREVERLGRRRHPRRTRRRGRPAPPAPGRHAAVSTHRPPARRTRRTASPASSTDVRPSSETWTGVGRRPRTSRCAAAARPRSSRRASRPRPGRTRTPRTTTSATGPSDGNASAMALIVCTSGIDAGQRVEVARVRSSSRAPARRARPRRHRRAASAATGCRSTGPSIRRLIPPRPIRRFSRHSSGTRGRSTQRPSLASSAGSTVIEPSTAIATTRIEPVARRVEGGVADDEQAGHRRRSRRRRRRRSSGRRSARRSRPRRACCGPSARSSRSRLR